MSRREIAASLVLAVASVMTQSCARDRIWEVGNSYRMEFNIRDSVMYNSPGSPELLWLRFYDPETGMVVKEMYAYPEGIDFSIPPGCYDIVAYTCHNAATKVTYTYDLSILTAETELISTTPYTIIAAPSHIYVGQLEDYTIPTIGESDGTFLIKLSLESPVDSWRVIVNGIDNLEYATSIQFYITGQYRDVLLDGLRREGEATVVFNGHSNTACDRLETGFNTFGMIPGRPYEMQLCITDESNTSYRKALDITDQVLDSSNVTHTISFDYDISLQTMVQGGLTPSADEWDAQREHWTVH